MGCGETDTFCLFECLILQVYNLIYRIWLMDAYDILCKNLQRQTRKGQPELGMAMLQDFYLRNGLEPDCRYREWMAHYKLIRLAINQKKGLMFDPMTDRNFLEAKEYFESPHDIPEGWEDEQEEVMEDLRRIEQTNKQLHFECLNESVYGK